VDSPSLLTGQVTVVGKVVRTLAGEGKTYFDVETAARYGRAVQDADPAVQQVLGVAGADSREVVNESARVGAPALVVLPLAVYK
jgi:Na+-translocating ferredoxin:NAD+ oxidoreductase RnfC subunit